MKKKVSDLGRPDPVVYTEEDGETVAFVMPRRFVHFSRLERKQFEALGAALEKSGQDLVDYLETIKGSDLGTPEYATRRAEIEAAMQEAFWNVAKMIVPDLSRERFDAMPEIALKDLVEEFRSPPFEKRTGDPETSASDET